MSVDPTPEPDPTNPGDPATQLTEANERIARLSRDLDDLRTEQRLVHKLAAAGVVDLETAVLVAQARTNGGDPAQIDACIAQLRKDKAYLFGPPADPATARRTAGVKDRTTPGGTALQQAATKAARTGSRADLLQYLRLRRNLVS
ncbi:MAG: hypothetical protein MUC88_27410 [Planctomycetes bacterium]|jgi:hypothetical protein|nr:hypothetical protein [Planctomycetota bacterium]